MLFSLNEMYFPWLPESLLCWVMTPVSYLYHLDRFAQGYCLSAFLWQLCLKFNREALGDY